MQLSGGNGPSSYETGSDGENSAALLARKFKTITWSHGLWKHMNPCVRLSIRSGWTTGNGRRDSHTFQSRPMFPPPGPNKLNWTGNTGSASSIYTVGSPERTHTSTLPRRWIFKFRNVGYSRIQTSDEFSFGRFVRVK